MQHRLPPGPRGLSQAPYFLRMRKDMLGGLSQLRDDFGEIAYFEPGGQPFCLVQRPEWIHQMLTRDNAQFKKGRFLEIAKDLLGEGLLTSEGEFHRHQRQLIQPMFYRQMIQRYGEIMVVWAERFAQRWQAGEVIDLAHEMPRLTLAVVGEALFGVNIEQDAQEIGQALENVLDLSIASQPLRRLTRKWPSPSRQRFLRSKQILDDAIQNIIDKNQDLQSDPEAAPKTLIHILMQARDEQGQGMSNTQIRDEALTLFLAGHETTANAMAWSLYLLSQSPRVEAKLQQELDQVLGQGRADVAEMNQLSYTRQILTESMRIYPPAWLLGRRVLNDYQLGAYTLPKNTIVIMSQYLNHHDAHYFSDPEQFIPERWSPSFKQSLPKGVYFPFSMGPRNCIGEAFAWMEGILMLATLAQHWQFQLVAGQQIAMHPQVTLRPKFGLKMRLQKRPD